MSVCDGGMLYHSWTELAGYEADLREVLHEAITHVLFVSLSMQRVGEVIGAAAGSLFKMVMPLSPPHFIHPSSLLGVYNCYDIPLELRSTYLRGLCGATASAGSVDLLVQEIVHVR